MSLRYDGLIEKDLNVGTGMVWIHAPAGGELCSTQVGIHTVARGQKAYTKSWAPGAVAAVSYATTTVTVPDATPGDHVMASFTTMVANDLRIVGHVSASDTVKVVLNNPTAASITPATGTLSVLVFPSLGAAAPIAAPVAEFTWVVGTPGATETDVQFTDASSGGTPPYSYLWDFGGGMGDTEDPNPLVTYGKGGGGNSQIFTVILTITDQAAQVDNVSHNVTVTFTGGGG